MARYALVPVCVVGGDVRLGVLYRSQDYAQLIVLAEISDDLDHVDSNNVIDEVVVMFRQRLEEQGYFERPDRYRVIISPEGYDFISFEEYTALADFIVERTGSEPIVVTELTGDRNANY